MLRATKPKESTMTWITQNWTSGQLNALVKKIGGEEVARGILDGSLVFKIEKPAVSPLLERLGTSLVLATTGPFVASEKFKLKKDGGICSHLGNDFQSWFLGKTEEAKGETTLRFARLTRNSLDKPILDELGDKAETSLAEMFAMMEAQARRQESPLLVNIFANTFYIRDANNVLRVVRVFFVQGGWNVIAFSTYSPGGCSEGDRIFSRNS